MTTEQVQKQILHHWRRIWHDSVQSFSVPLVIPNLAQARALQTCKFWNILQAGWKGVSLTASCCLSSRSLHTSILGLQADYVHHKFGWEKSNMFAVWRRCLPILSCLLLLIFSSVIHRKAFQVLLLTYQYPALCLYTSIPLYYNVQNIETSP